MIRLRALLFALGLAACGVLAFVGGVGAQDAMPDDDVVPKPTVRPGSSAAQEAPPAPVPEGESDVSADHVTLGGLDKVSARVVTIEAEVGQTTHFGTLEIIVRACRQHRPEESPENAAFLDVWDIKPGKPAQSVFRGWMFSSSPALSAMEHPIYDIWVLSCRAGRK